MFRHVALRPVTTHEKMFVYRKSLDAAEACEWVARKVATSRPDLCDQLRRASCSIPHNIAEGASEFSRREKQRFYRIARRSAAECQAILDTIARFAEGAPPTGAARAALDEVIALLIRTSKSLEA